MVFSFVHRLLCRPLSRVHCLKPPQRPPEIELLQQLEHIGGACGQAAQFWASNFLVLLRKLGQLWNPPFVAWPLELGLGNCYPHFVTWPLELGLGTSNPRFVALPLEFGLRTHNQRFVAWPLELGLGTHNPRFIVWPLELGLGTPNPRLVALALESRALSQATPPPT